MGGPCVLILAALIGLFVWFLALLRDSFSRKADQSLARHVRGLAVKWGLWLLGLLFVVALIPTFPGAGEAARRAMCINHLKQIGVAMHNYHDAYGCFPPAYTTDEQGSRLHSWRTLLLPFMEEDKLYKQLRLDEPWDSPQNQSILKNRDAPSIYRCLSAADDRKLTNYVMIVGPETISDGTGCLCLEDITDGPANTIIVVEVTDWGTHWAEPRDLDFRKMSFTINDQEGQAIRSGHPGLANVLFGDGSIQSISKEIDPQLLKALITVAAGDDTSPFFDNL